MKKTIKFFRESKLAGPIRRAFIRILNYVVSKNQGVVVFYNEPKRTKIIDLAKKIRKETHFLLGDNEAYQIYMCVKKTEKIKGDIAEVGTYKGGSAKLISEAKGNKSLHLFDTFEGLPEPGSKDKNKQFHKGQFNATIKSVKRYLRKYKKVYFYKGLFPSTGEPIKDKKFSFVHLDVDLYEATLESIKFFYPRMSKGGIILSHDFILAPGIEKAFEEFFKDKPEPIIEMSGYQCLIVKT